MASELLEKLCSKTLDQATWPSYDPVLVQEDEVNVIVQVNGKLRGTLRLKKGKSREFVEQEAKKIALKWLDGQDGIKVVFVPDKLINFVIK